MSPSLALEPAGGQVVITRFECPGLLAMLAVLVLHVRVKRDVRRRVPGFIGIVLLRDWRRRTVLSISLWPDVATVYGMGSVSRHVAASRVPGSLGIRTTCGFFCYAGDWRRVMFGTGTDAGSPLAAYQAPDRAPDQASGTHVKEEP